MPETLDLTPDEILATTRAVRRRLDFDRPISRAVLLECVELAIQAPNASNAQNWQFMIVDKREQIAALAAIYRRSYDEIAAVAVDAYDKSDPVHARLTRINASADYLRANLHRVPAMLVPCITPRVESRTARPWAVPGYWSSILLAAWSFMLAARARGIGSSWTGLHLRYEREAAEVLGIPFDEWAQACLIPLGYTIGTDFRPAYRLPAQEVTRWNRW